MGALPYDDPRFLEPAHDHDPSDISYLTDLPPSSPSYIPDEVQDLLPAVQEATSIVFASFNRLDDLLSQRLERLTVLPEEDRKPGPGNIQCRWYFSYRPILILPPHLLTLLKDPTCRFRTSLFLVSEPGKERSAISYHGGTSRLETQNGQTGTRMLSTWDHDLS